MKERRVPLSVVGLSVLYRPQSRQPSIYVPVPESGSAGEVDEVNPAARDAPDDITHETVLLRIRLECTEALSPVYAPGDAALLLRRSQVPKPVQSRGQPDGRLGHLPNQLYECRMLHMAVRTNRPLRSLLRRIKIVYERLENPPFQ